MGNVGDRFRRPTVQHMETVKDLYIYLFIFDNNKKNQHICMCVYIDLISHRMAHSETITNVKCW